MKIEYDNHFWHDDGDERSRVLQILPDVHRDDRGCFLESWKCLDENDVDKDVYEKLPWILKTQWVKQMNTSYSHELVVRGCHAQSGAFCQAKLVWSQLGRIFDVITDARPNSATFMKTKVFCLNPKTQNRLFVPRGFLHAFLTSDKDMGDGAYIFNYMCDNLYNKQFEVCVRPDDIVRPAFEKYCDKYGLDNFMSEVATSEKDKAGVPKDKFFGEVKRAWDNDGALWYQ